MRVPDLIAHNPVFLAVEIDDQPRMAGTGFVIGVASERNPEVTYGYLVTARHCVEKARQHGPLGARVNRRRDPGPVTLAPDSWVVGGSELFGPLEDWTFHDDPSNDVAVIPFMPSTQENMVVIVQHESCATAAVVEREQIGIGDDLIVVGLFSAHHGRDINRPIVRAGNIAAMPNEPIADPLGGLSYDAYLVEVRSVGGLSGSPVWMVINPGRVTPGSSARENRLHFYLLGLVRGHWTKESEWLADFADEADTLNTGIAIVTPIQKALDTIDSEKEVARRWQNDDAGT
jgi:hypothetical protein